MATLLQPPPAQSFGANGSVPVLLASPSAKTTSESKDLTAWHDLVVQERTRRDKWLRPWSRRSDSRPLHQLSPPSLPNGIASQPRQLTTTDSEANAGTETPVTTPVSAASHGTGGSTLREDPATQQRSQAAPATEIPVEVRLSIPERLRTLVLASSLGLKADPMVDFTESDKQKLHQFQREFNRVRMEWFRGRPMPSMRFELVVLRKDGAKQQGSGATTHGRIEGTTSICIRGLQTDKDIQEFHRVMSRDFVRRLYPGLRLSYDRSLINTVAKEAEQVHEYQPSWLGETLCGAALHTMTAGASGYQSTIGGVVNAGGLLFAISTSHQAENRAQPSGAASSRDSTLMEGEYDEDVESPLILDLLEEMKTPEANDSEAPSISRLHWDSLSANTTSAGLAGDDWRLIPMSGRHCLPNAVPTDLLSGRFKGPSTKEGKKTYIVDYIKTPTLKRVFVLGGFTKLSTATLLSSPSFLSIHGGPADEIWTAIVDQPILRKGDSGSWVIDEQGLLVGIVRAISTNQIYIVPFSVQKTEIVSQAHQLHDISLPSPLQCWLEVAVDDREGSSITADEAVANALSPAVLTASADVDPLARVLQTALRELGASPLGLKQLGSVLHRDGNQIRNFLNRTDDPGWTARALISSIYPKLADIHCRMNSSDGAGSSTYVSTSEKNISSMPCKTNPPGIPQEPDRNTDGNPDGMLATQSITNILISSTSSSPADAPGHSHL